MNDKHEYIEFHDGSRIDFTQATHRVSTDIYQMQDHYKLCQDIAEQYSQYGYQIQAVIENFLAWKSTRTKQFSAAIWLTKNRTDEIRSVAIDANYFERLKKLFPSTISVYSATSNNSTHISNKMLFTLFAKYLSHWFFICFSTAPTKTKTIIRAWCDVTEKLFAEHFGNSELRIFPFPLSISRQLRFIQHCRRNSIRYSLDGIPYSLFFFLKLVVASDRLLAFARFELDGNIGYGKKLQSWGIRNVFTSDEYESAAFGIYEEFIKNGGTVTNSAHGIGQYCPYVKYSTFQYLSSPQKIFYMHRFPEMKMELRKSVNSVFPFSFEECADSDQVVLVLIHQNQKQSGLIAEAELQLQLCKHLSDKVKELTHVEFRIKLHPNINERNKVDIALELGGTAMTTWTELKGKRPIFFTINSTAFLELYRSAPVFFFTAPSFDPEHYFGPNIPKTDAHSIDQLIDSLQQKQEWILKTRSLISAYEKQN